jgi:uncharacterized protein (DUF1778 family)
MKEKEVKVAAHHQDAHHMDTHMNFRMLSTDKEIIETAASLKGLKPQTYARQKLLESAKKDIAEMNLSNTIVLDSESWEQFMAIMEAPVHINTNLKAAVAKFNKTMKK